MGKLFIDTSDNKKITVAINSKMQTVYKRSGFIKSEVCLPLIDALCKENKISILDIKAININIGPGSFTGLRVGASIANALGFLLKISINDRKIGEPIFPVYN